MRMRRVTAVVIVPAYGEFPMDMLRYDSCFPTKEEDAARLGQVSDQLRLVTVARWHQHWTVCRWQSFGVQLVQVTDLSDYAKRHLAAGR